MNTLATHAQWPLDEVVVGVEAGYGELGRRRDRARFAKPFRGDAAAVAAAVGVRSYLGLPLAAKPNELRRKRQIHV